MTKRKNKDSHLLLGKIVGVFGRKGEVKLFSNWTIDAVDFIAKNVYIYLPEGEILELKLEGVRHHKKFNLLTLQEINSIESAEKLVGGEVFIDDDDLPRGDGEIYFSDIYEAEAVDEDGNVIGKIVGFIELKIYDLLEIRLENGDTIEVPYIDAFIKEIDLKNKKIVFYNSRIKGYYAN